MATRDRKPTRFKGIVVALAGGVLLVVAAVMTIQSLRPVWFHSVQGTVISKKLHSVVTGRINLHKHVIDYSYVVGGIPYRNNVFTLVEDDGTEDWARSILRDFRVGAPCTVYYDPLNPETSALSTRPNSRAIWLIILSAFLGVVSVVGGTMAVRAASLPNKPVG